VIILYCKIKFHRNVCNLYIPFVWLSQNDRKKKKSGIRKTSKIKTRTPHYQKPNTGLERRKEESKID
jgi:hypothetical protein